MGRYLRRSSRLASVGEVAPPPQCGVRTRSKAVAVQQPASGDAGYLQLPHSRRLEKAKGSGSPLKSRGVLRGGGCGDHVEEDEREWGGAAAEVRRMVAKAYAIMRWEAAGDGGQEHEEESVQASCGDDGLLQLEVVESRGERCSRETTPCNLIFSSVAARTPPGSSTTRRRRRSRHAKDGAVTVATPPEMEEFFCGAEVEQQRVFVDRYNFDVVNECPLPGRYEWEKLGSW